MSDESLMPLLTSARRERDTYRDAAVRGQKALEACEADRDALLAVAARANRLWEPGRKGYAAVFQHLQEALAALPPHLKRELE